MSRKLLPLNPQPQAQDWLNGSENVIGKRSNFHHIHNTNEAIYTL